MFGNNSSTIETPFWLIPVDILMILSAIFIVVANIIFILTIIFDKTCHSIPMMLTANTCLSLLVFGCIRITTTFHVLHNDLQQIEYQYPACTFLGYLGYVVYAVQNYSFFQQALYRYMIVVYPTRFFWQSAKFHSLLICLVWISGFICSLPYILPDEIHYDAPNQICQLSFRLSFVMIYSMFIIYIIPMSAIMIVYLKLVRYVKEMSQNITPVNTLTRAQRELKIFQRTVIFVNGLIAIGFPYALFIFISFFTSPPKYHFRISYAFGDAALPSLMIVLFIFTVPVKESVMNRLNERINMVLPLCI